MKDESACCMLDVLESRCSIFFLFVLERQNRDCVGNN